MVRLEEHEAFLLVQRARLELEPRGIDVRADDLEALPQALPSRHHDGQGSIAVHVVEPQPRGVRRESSSSSLDAGLAQDADGFSNEAELALRDVHERLVRFGMRLDARSFCLGEPEPRGSALALRLRNGSKGEESEESSQHVGPPGGGL